MRSVSLLTVTCALALVLPTTAGASDLSEYRGFTLGDPLQVVIDRLQLAASDVKVVHERPTVQEVTWRPTQFVSGRAGETDSLAEMVLTFNEGRLARIRVMYDRARTQGLTDEDLHDAIASVYGVSLLMPVPPQRSISPPTARQPIGRWEDAKTFVLLWREDYPTRVGLAITSTASELALQEGIEEGLPLHAIQGAATDRVSGTAEAAALQARDEKTRRDNKATFKP
jgi:hypothetical protein